MTRVHVVRDSDTPEVSTSSDVLGALITPTTLFGRLRHLWPRRAVGRK